MCCGNRNDLCFPDSSQWLLGYLLNSESYASLPGGGGGVIKSGVAEPISE